MQIGFPQNVAAPAHVRVVLVSPAEAREGLVGPAAALEAAGGGQLGRALKAARFEGDAASLVEILAPAGLEATRLLVLGTGPADKADAAVFEKIGAAIVARLLTSGEVQVSVDMAGVQAALPLAEAAAHLAHGAALRAWRFDRYRTTMKEKQKPSLTAFDVLGVTGAEAWHDRLAAIAAGVARTRELVSEPANILYPESFVERAMDLANLGVELTVLDDEEMRALGMGALLGVAQGSVRPARMLAMRWNGLGSVDGAAGKPVVFIGKGVTFDTGGISIKPAAGMEDMKWDMGGAAAVAGAMKALAGRRAKAHVIGVCGLVENMPDGLAQRPGDVVTSMSGQTIEVINTDAEGRLVLADALTWVQRVHKPKTIIDLATLTGAMIIALGNEHGGLFANDDRLAEQLLAAGTAAGDPVWRFPLGDAYNKLIDSPIADMKNVGPRGAGSITAAQFLQRFIDDGVRWAHLDIAGMVWADKPGHLWDKGATGFGVRLLDRFVADVVEA